MTEARLFWCGIGLGQIVLYGSAYVWWRAGLGWALAYALGVLLAAGGIACFALVAAFFWATAPRTCPHCGVEVPRRYSGGRSRRAYCDTCLDRIRRANPAATEAYRL